ncbi:MAG: tetratricopeptide repeat protein [Gemmatales bacterium]
MRFLPVFHVGFILILLNVLPAAVLGQDKSWFGENVLQTRHSGEITFGTRANEKQVNYTFSGRWPFKVREEKDGWIRIHDGNHEGWAKKSDFVLAKEAYDYFTQRIEANPKDHFALLMRGGYWSEKKEHDKAIQDYDECLRLNPSNATAFNNRGNARLDKKEYDKAIEDFTESIRLNSKSVTSRLGRGIAWKNKKEYDKALNDYDETLKIDPRYCNGYYHRGVVWAIKLDRDKAIADFTEAIRIDPRHVAAHYERGLAWMAKNDRDKAIEDFDVTVRLDPKHAQAFYRRAVAWRGKKDNDKALRDYSEAIRINPRYAYAIQGRALLHRSMKNYDKAIEDYQTVIQAEPTNAVYLNQYSWLLATCPDAQYRNGTKAVELALKSCELTKKSTSSMEALAAAYAETGDFAEAVKWQKLALDSLLSSPRSTDASRERLKLYEENKPYHEK